MANTDDIDGDDAPTRLLGPAPITAAVGSEPLAGQRIGDYVLQRRLGAGGMGEVWLAEQQQPVRRPVALKLMRRQILNPLSEAYFEVERQALARMDHPAIARIYDAGRSAEGHPWFAMEYVDGQPLDSWCRAQAPSLRQRVELLVALARGVEHAHQRGVLHRDLKPSNVLVQVVDGQPRPRLIDFGIALGFGAQGGLGETHSYEAAGSGVYMSPEQRAGDASAVDPRADVYALGMIALCLLLPQSRLSALGEDLEQAQRLSQRLERARGHAGDAALSTLPVPLLWVLSRALSPAQADRYASAEAFAADLERWLALRPVQAAPASRRYRLRCFLRRNAIAVAATGAVVLALVAGLSATAWGLHQARLEGERARAMADFMADVLTGADPDRARDLDRSLLRLILGEAAARAEGELSQRPEVLAQIESVIGSTYNSLGETDEALAFIRRAHERVLASLGPNHRDSLRVAQRLSDALVAKGEFEEAEQIAAEALPRALARLDPDDALIADLRLTLSWAIRDQGRYAEALPLAEAAVAQLARRPRADDPDPLGARFIEAILLADLERFEAAEAGLRNLLSERSAINGADHPRTLRIYNSLAVILLQQRRYTEAEPLLRTALPLSEASFGPDHASTLGMVTNLAGALRQQGKVDESGPFYLRAAESHRRVFGEDHPRTLASRNNLGNYLLDSGDAEAALSEYRAGLERALPVLGEDHPISSELVFGIGKALVALGDREQGRAELERALAIKHRIYGESHRTIDNVRRELEKLGEGV